MLSCVSCCVVTSYCKPSVPGDSVNSLHYFKFLDHVQSFTPGLASNELSVKVKKYFSVPEEESMHNLS